MDARRIPTRPARPVEVNPFTLAATVAKGTLKWKEFTKALTIARKLVRGEVEVFA